MQSLIDGLDVQISELVNIWISKYFQYPFSVSDVGTWDVVGDKRVNGDNWISPWFFWIFRIKAREKLLETRGLMVRLMTVWMIRLFLSWRRNLHHLFPIENKAGFQLSLCLFSSFLLHPRLWPSKTPTTSIYFIEISISFSALKEVISRPRV